MSCWKGRCPVFGRLNTRYLAAAAPQQWFSNDSILCAVNASCLECAIKLKTELCGDVCLHGGSAPFFPT